MAKAWKWEPTEATELGLMSIGRWAWSEKRPWYFKGIDVVIDLKAGRLEANDNGGRSCSRKSRPSSLRDSQGTTRMATPFVLDEGSGYGDGGVIFGDGASGGEGGSLGQDIGTGSQTPVNFGSGVGNGHFEGLLCYNPTDLRCLLIEARCVL